MQEVQRLLSGRMQDILLLSISQKENSLREGHKSQRVIRVFSRWEKQTVRKNRQIVAFNQEKFLAFFFFFLDS